MGLWRGVYRCMREWGRRRSPASPSHELLAKGRSGNKPELLDETPKRHRRSEIATGDLPPVRDREHVTAQTSVDEFDDVVPNLLEVEKVELCVNHRHHLIRHNTGRRMVVNRGGMKNRLHSFSNLTKQCRWLFWRADPVDHLCSLSLVCEK